MIRTKYYARNFVNGTMCHIIDYEYMSMIQAVLTPIHECLNRTNHVNRKQVISKLFCRKSQSSRTLTCAVMITDTDTCMGVYVSVCVCVCVCARVKTSTARQHCPKPLVIQEIETSSHE